MLSMFARSVIGKQQKCLAMALGRQAVAVGVSTTPRAYHVSAARYDDLPYHIVVGLPALSPTMETGSLAEWYVGEGDAVSAGDAVAKIETDKASMDWEAQDDIYIAKLLLTPENGTDLAVGTPVMITVEDEADVAAFKDYIYKGETVDAPAAAAPTPESAAPPKPAQQAPAQPAAPPTPTAPVKDSAAAAAPPTPPTPPSPAASAAPSSAPPAPAAGDGRSINMTWARPVSATSPLTKSMKKQQADYMKLYGTTGQKAAVLAEK